MAQLVTLTISFDIDNNDKEHQDYVDVLVRNRDGEELAKRVCPASTNNGDGSDPNAYYWPSDGPGKHTHTYSMNIGRLRIDSRNLSGCHIIISTGSGTGDSFESWNAFVNATADNTDGDTVTLLSQRRIEFGSAGSADLPL